MTQTELLKHIASVSKKTSADVYVVGGFVRDQLLEKQFPKQYPRTQANPQKSPVKSAIEQDIIDGGGELIIEKPKKLTDIDFVVDGSGLAFAKELDTELEELGSLIEFPDFDTARYVIEQENGNIEVEFAGARTESYTDDSRKPVVTPTTIDDDLKRRDFTVNAMARQVQPDGTLGDLIDPYNGQQDLKNKVLKTPLNPNETFSEDPLRMMRAARFAAQLDFQIEEQTYQALIDNAKRLSIISKERIQEEFFKTLATKVPSTGLWILFKTKLFDEFLPEVSALDGVEEAYGQNHKNNLSHTFLVVDNIAERTNKVPLRYAALMHDIGKPGTKEFIKGRGWAFDMHEHLGRKITRTVGKRLRMSKDITEYVAHLVRWHQQPIQLMDTGVTDSAVRRLVFNLSNDIDDLLTLCRSDITTGNPKKLKRRLKNYDVLEERIIEVIQKDKLRNFHSPVRGEEIMEICSIKPGPTVGRIKKAIEEAILDGNIQNNYEEAHKYFLEIKDTFLSEVCDWEKQ